MSNDNKHSRNISLPGIHEMLPEHMFRDDSLASPHRRTRPSPHFSPGDYSHRNLIVNPANSPSANDRHLYDNSPSMARRYTVPSQTHPGGRAVALPPDLSGLPMPSHPHEPWDYNAPRQHTPDDRRHACCHCNKRFNRPSSLATHMNTHTGARPYECPFPGCYKRFNVNSNMRRHYRNHGSTSPLTPFPHSSSPSTTTFDRSRSYSTSPTTSFHRHYTDDEDDEGVEDESDDEMHGQRNLSFDGRQASINLRLPVAPAVRQKYTIPFLGSPQGRGSRADRV